MVVSYKVREESAFYNKASFESEDLLAQKVTSLAHYQANLNEQTINPNPIHPKYLAWRHSQPSDLIRGHFDTQANISGQIISPFGLITSLLDQWLGWVILSEFYNLNNLRAEKVGK